MIRSTLSRIGRAGVVTGLGALVVLGGAGIAHASQGAGGSLNPTNQVCTAQQYASYQVRGYGQADAGGAKFKLLRNGVVVANTSTRVPSATLIGRSSEGSFWGPGNYQMCANNTGTAPTNVVLNLLTDAEFV